MTILVPATSLGRQNRIRWSLRIHQAPGEILILASCPKGSHRPICIEGLDRPRSPPRLFRNIEQFELGERVYTGKTSRVYSATHIPTGTSTALKLYRKKALSALNLHQVARECRLHSSLEHPNIVKLLATFEDESNSYLVLEKANLGDLAAEDNSKGLRLVRPSGTAVSMVWHRSTPHSFAV